MNAALTLQQIKRKSLPILKRSGVRRSAIFGSFARGEAKKTSDVDFLVEYAPKTSLLDVVQLREDLQHVLGRKVDLVSYRSLSPRLKPFIMKDVFPLYET
jgi:predicted nucleotidyltransferase